MGYIGDTLSQKRALEISIFLMAFPTLAMGCLPTFDVWRWYAVVALVFVWLIQGLSVGGQLMSSLVFVLEGHDRSKWGWYGSWCMTSANIGTFLGGLVGYGMRAYFTYEELSDGGWWRIPFLCGVFVCGSGFYLKHHVKDHEKNIESGGASIDDKDNSEGRQGQQRALTPLELAFSTKIRGSLLSVIASVILWAGGFYLTFV